MAVTDRVSVMRRGEMVATLDTAATSPAELAELMVGRRVLLRVQKDAARPGRTMLSCRNLTVRDGHGTPRVDDVSLEVRAGEIVGIAGIAGNGQSELLEALAGMRPVASGTIAFDGQPVPEATRDPHDLRQRGLLHVPEDRLRMGLVPAFAAMESAILGFHDEPRYGSGILLDVRAIEQDTAGKMEAYDVRPRAPRLKTSKFSGGNQQKLVLAREIERAPKVLLVGQPTRGVDIGAIEFIHRRIVALRDEGVAVLLVSVELEEILGLADRILVMCGGRITGERLPGACDEQDLGLLMAGVTERAA
jgi:simple sugar transport system ATP-binding protein